MRNEGEWEWLFIYEMRLFCGCKLILSFFICSV